MGFVVQSLSSVWLLQPHELQHTSLFCSSPSPRACLNSCPLNQLCRPTVLSSVVPVLLPSIFPSIRVFYNESALCIRWPKYWSFSISSTNEYSGLISFRIDWFDLAVERTLKSLLQHHSLKASILQPSAFFRCPALTFVHDYWKNHSFDYMDFGGKVMSLLFNMLSRFVMFLMAFLPRNKCLLISWLQ